MSRRRIKREYFEAGQCEVLPPCLTLVGECYHHGHYLADHVHPDCFEICFIRQGDLRWWTGDTTYHLTRDNLYVTLPGEIHGVENRHLDQCELYWLNLNLKVEQGLPGLSSAQLGAITDVLTNLETRNFPSFQPKLIVHVFRMILNECRRPRQDSTAVIQANVNLFLLQVCRDHEAHTLESPATGATQGQPDRTISTCLKWLEANLLGPVAVDDLVDASGLKVSRFYERFLNQTGYTPAQYINHRKIECAKEMLKKSQQTVTEIAFALGYSSSQYFATVFKRETGTTPRAYRQTHMSRPPVITS